VLLGRRRCLKLCCSARIGVNPPSVSDTGFDAALTAGRLA